MPPTNALGLFNQGDLSEATAQQLTCSRQAGDASADNANTVFRDSGLSNATCLFKQLAVVKTQIGRIGETGGPFT
ncbi:hypothetical protein D3C79_1052340 [compost metagenome]